MLNFCTLAVVSTSNFFKFTKYVSIYLYDVIMSKSRHHILFFTAFFFFVLFDLVQYVPDFIFFASVYHTSLNHLINTKFDKLYIFSQIGPPRQVYAWPLYMVGGVKCPSQEHDIALRSSKA